MLKVFSELTKLKQVVVCWPGYFEIIEAIDSTQEYFFKTNPPKKDKLIREHMAFCDTLRSHGISLEFTPPKQGCPYQLFTRDVGFIIGDYLYISRMAKDLRRKEEEVFIGLAQDSDWSFLKLTEESIEGGDICVIDNIVLVGIGDRTSLQACNDLTANLSSRFKVITVCIQPGICHLDTVFSILPRRVILYYPKGLVDNVPAELKNYEIVEVTEAEMRGMACNVLTISEDVVISQERHERLNVILSNKSIEVSPVKLEEIAKLGGGPRCLVLPLETY